MMHRRISSLTTLVLTVALTVLATGAGAQTKNQTPQPEVVNINTATAEQLALLPRVGPSLSGRILEFRKENGEFKKTEDLILVRGIGEKTFENLEPFVTVKGETTLKRKLRSSDVEAVLAARTDSKNEQAERKEE